MRRPFLHSSTFFQLLIIVSFCWIGAQNNPPEINNISAAFDIQDGVVLINYDLNDPEQDTMKVTFKMSNDGGQTYTFPVESVVGDVGYPILSGSDKQIMWYYPPEAIDDSASYRAKIVADDLYEIEIEELVDEVTIANLITDLTFVEGIRHRTTGFEHLEETKAFIEDRFIQNNLDVSQQQFSYGGYEAANLIGRLPGHTDEEIVFIIDGHFDTVSNSPGADDNGTGVVGMLEAMRVLALYNFKYTIKFIGFDLEEPYPYLIGSSQYVNEAVLADDQIEGVFNFEMIGYYCDWPGCQTLPYGFDILFPLAYNLIASQSFRGNFIANFANENSNPLKAQFDVCSAQYVPDLRVISAAVPGNGEVAPDLRRSDHAPFWDAGYQALFLTDGGNFRNPHYHSPSDLIETLNFGFATNVVKATVATVDTLAEVIHCGVGESENFQITNVVIGDINQDGNLDVLDIVQAVECILEEPPYNCELADVNTDGNVDVLDIVQMVSLILGN
ncbi:MAG: M28 family peptidase [Candidatus Marinimicrobia bacterium]|nr:M28 family peptidase [Candidatus Neomarinimicrobiota bacterium]